MNKPTALDVVSAFAPSVFVLTLCGLVVMLLAEVDEQRARIDRLSDVVEHQEAALDDLANDLDELARFTFNEARARR